MAKPPADAEAFRRELAQRQAAADKLDHDLRTEVPLLYGSPGRGEPAGDPGIILARLHREELVRRAGGGVPDGKPDRLATMLPFERTVLAIAIGFVVWYFVFA